jgi:type II secretory pathway component GspD/PulD (secretin)
MRTSFQILIVVGLTLGMAYGQEQTDSVQSVMNELSAYQGVKPAVPVAATPVAEKPAAAPAAAVEPAPAVMAAEPAPVAVVAAPVDVPAVLEKSCELFVAGDCAKAEAGFKTVLAAEPKNKIAALYLQEIRKTRHLKTEESAMGAVSESWGGMEMRYYPLEGKVLQNLGLADAQEPVNIENKFPFVTFAKGASAIYRPGLKKLFVRNTPGNLETVESILVNLGRAEQQASAEQVKIETRFVEFNEGALQELGFNWSNPNGDGTQLPADWSVEPGQNLFSGALRSLPYSQTATLGLGEVSSREGNNRIDNWNVNRMEDMFNNSTTGNNLIDPARPDVIPGTVSLSGEVFGDPVDLLIRALDQTSGADVLSAPSILTLSGEKATITVGERHFYPETYESGSSQGTMVHVKYADFKEKILGVEMTVTPTIKGDDIQMKIQPKITELIGWQQFQLSPADTSYTYYQYRIGQQFEHDPVIAKLPIFNRREVNTEVSVASGSTVGMGGMIGEKKEAFSDRVPVLGSIPLVGRLFRSEGSRTVKRNLMIFVTASKVAPSGRIVSERSFE